MSTPSRRCGWSGQNHYFSTHKNPGPLAVKVGDSVAYCQYALRQLADGPTDPLCHRRGVVVAVNVGPSSMHLVKVQWDDADEPQSISSGALAFPGPNLRFVAD